MRAGMAAAPCNVAPPPPPRPGAQAFQQKATPAAGYRTAPWQAERNDCRLPRRVCARNGRCSGQRRSPAASAHGSASVSVGTCPRQQATGLLRAALHAPDRAAAASRSSRRARRRPGTRERLRSDAGHANPAACGPERPLLRATSLPAASAHGSASVSVGTCPGSRLPDCSGPLCTRLTARGGGFMGIGARGRGAAPAN